VSRRAHNARLPHVSGVSPPLREILSATGDGHLPVQQPVHETLCVLSTRNVAINASKTSTAHWPDVYFDNHCARIPHRQELHPVTNEFAARMMAAWRAAVRAAAPVGWAAPSLGTGGAGAGGGSGASDAGVTPLCRIPGTTLDRRQLGRRVDAPVANPGDDSGPAAAAQAQLGVRPAWAARAGSSKRDAGQAGTTGTACTRGRLPPNLHSPPRATPTPTTHRGRVLTALNPHVQWVCGSDSTDGGVADSARSPWSIRITCNTSTRSRQEEWQRTPLLTAAGDVRESTSLALLLRRLARSRSSTVPRLAADSYSYYGGEPGVSRQRT